MYYLANGKYATDITELADVFPAGCNDSGNCEKFSLTEAKDANTVYYVVGFLKKNKVGVGNSLVMFLDRQGGQIDCYAYKGDGERGRKLCKSIGGKLRGTENGACAGDCSIYTL